MVGLAFTTWKGIFGILVLLALQAYSYVGILDNAANRSASDTSLVGGASLDILGLTLLIQFLTVLVSPAFYWLLVILPIWGAYFLYTTFRGDATKAAAPAAATNDAATEAQTERRQKRAERRRQKRY